MMERDEVAEQLLVQLRLALGRVTLRRLPAWQGRLARNKQRVMDLLCATTGAISMATAVGKDTETGKSVVRYYLVFRGGEG
jgi:hypothetical protein